MKLVDAAKAATPMARRPFLMNFELENQLFRNTKCEDEYHFIEEDEVGEKFTFSAESDFHLLVATQATKGDKGMQRMQHHSFCTVRYSYILFALCFLAELSRRLHLRSSAAVFVGVHVWAGSESKSQDRSNVKQAVIAIRNKYD
jgi:hypothetical protein